MRHRIRIFAVAIVLALSLGMAVPAQALSGGDHGARPAASRWRAAVNALATLFGLDRPAVQNDGSCSIDPGGKPVCPAPKPTLQNDNSVCIDPNGNTVCYPGS